MEDQGIIGVKSKVELLELESEISPRSSHEEPNEEPDVEAAPAATSPPLSFAAIHELTLPRRTNKGFPRFISCIVCFAIAVLVSKGIRMPVENVSGSQRSSMGAIMEKQATMHKEAVIDQESAMDVESKIVVEASTASAADQAATVDEVIADQGTKTTEGTNQEVDARADNELLEASETNMGVNEEFDEKDMLVVPLTRQSESLKMVGQKMSYKSAYYGVVSAGGQEFTVVFDTGSGQLILPSTYCRSDTCKIHRRYSRMKSKTATDMNLDGSIIANPQGSRELLKVSFGTGSINGVVVEETVCLGEAAKYAAQINTASDPNAPLPKGCFQMRMLAATEMTADPFDTFAFDGVMGLALTDVSPGLQFNLGHMIGNHLAAWNHTRQMSNYFAIFLAQHAAERSEISFGGYRKQYVDGNVNWNDVYLPEHGHWLLKVKSIRVDDSPISFCNDGTCKAVLDTGTALVGVPKSGFGEVYSYMWHPASQEGACDSGSPLFTVELESGFEMSIEPQDYSVPVGYGPKAIEENKELPFTWGKPWSGGEEDYLKRATRFDLQCKPLLMSMEFPEPLGPKLFILGEPFLRRYYAIYDNDRKRVGLAKAKHAETDEVLDPLGIHKNRITASDESMDWFFDEISAD